MVNTGKPSTACLTCRRRKVKCDGAIPHCQRCARINRPCLGYRDQFDLIFKNTYVSIDARLHDKLYGLPTAVRQPYSTISYTTRDEPPNWHSQGYDAGKQLKAEQWTSAPTNDWQPIPETALLQKTWSRTNSQSESTDSRDESPDPEPSLPVDLPEHALCYSLIQFDTNSRVQYKIETFAFLPELVGRAGPKSAVHQAMRACGTINFANRAGPVDLHHETASEYARAIVSVNAALQDPVERCRDETLIAVWLLGMRELLLEVAGRSTTSSPDRAAMHRRQVHTDGTISLMGIRGEKQFERPLGRHISVTILSAMHWRSLFIGEEPSKDYLLLESQMEKASPVTFEPARKLRAFFHGVTKLRARIKNFTVIHTKRTDSERYEIVNSYLKAAERLERRMQDWCDVLEWQPQKATLGAEPPVIDSAYSSSTLYNYNALLLWNRYLVAKVALHAGLLDALQLLPEQDSSHIEGDTVDPVFADMEKHHKEALQDTTDRFIGIIAYAFGDIDPADSPSSHNSSQKARDININGALQVFQPLIFFTHLRYITDMQRNAIVEALHRITVEFRTR